MTEEGGRLLNGVVVVEWAERLPPSLRLDGIRITIETAGDDERRITIA